MTITKRADLVLQQIDAALALAEKATPGPLRVVEGQSELGDTNEFESWAQIETTSHRESDPVLMEIWNPNDEEVDTLKMFAASRTLLPASLRCLKTAIEGLLKVLQHHGDGGYKDDSNEHLTTLCDQWEASR